MPDSLGDGTPGSGGLFFSAGNQLYWLDSSLDEVLWSVDAGDNVSGGITVDRNGKVYFPQRNKGSLLVFDLVKKEKVAEFSNPGNYERGDAAVSIAEDGTVYWPNRTDASDYLYALVNHGALIRSLPIDAAIIKGLDVDSYGNLYVGHKATSGAWTVKKLNPAGTVENTFSTRGTGYYGGAFLGIVESVIRKYGGEVTFIPCDVSDEDSVNSAVAVAVDTYGSINILFNNAGGAGQGNFPDETAADFRRVINVNLNGTFYMSKALWPYMVSAGGGVVVNMSSLAAQRGSSPKMVDQFGSTSSSYWAAKAGVDALTRYMAGVGGRSNIRVMVCGLVKS